MKSFRPFLPAGRLHPGLLISANFERSSYCLFVTDGTYLWKQSVSSSELQSLSSTYESPIDAEDSEQLKVLLGKLQQGLTCKGDGCDGMETKLLRTSDAMFTSGGVPKRLVIHTKVPLDAPLPALDWRFYLDLTSQYEFTTTITLPLIRLVGLYQSKTAELLEHLKNKDTVITKLKDNAEMQKKDAINEIFHNKRSRQGLTQFDQKDWKNSFLLDGGNADMDWLYKDTENPKVEFQAVLGKAERIDENWWDTLTIEKKLALGRQNSEDLQLDSRAAGKNNSAAEPARKRSPTATSTPKNCGADGEVADEIVWTPEIRQQPLPSSAKRNTKSSKKQDTPPKDPDDPYSRLLSENDEEDDLDGPSSRSAQSTNVEHELLPNSMTLPGEGLGKLGSLRSRKWGVTPKVPASPKNAAETDDDATISEDEGLEKTKPASSKKTDVTPSLYTVASPKKPTSLSSTEKTKLGALGRKRTPDASEARSSTSETPCKPPSSQKLGRLGGIGATKHKEETAYETNISSGAPSSTENTSSVENIVTPVDPLDQEAADRKRKELERALEEKKKAPAKKKRKF